MNIVSRYLAGEDIVLGLDVPGKTRALEEVALLLERRHPVKHETVFRALCRREEIGSTAVGHGLAIPHARVAGLTQPIVLLTRTNVPIKFGAPDHQPVSVLFVIIVPEHANEEHLQILATVSQMFSDQSFRDRLEAATEPAAVRHLFHEWAMDSARAWTNNARSLRLARAKVVGRDKRSALRRLDPNHGSHPPRP